MNRVKFPKTYHLPWSETINDDDKKLSKTSHFEGADIVILEKMDGENTSMYSDFMHARSIDSKHNYTRDWAKKMHSILKNEIPKDWVFCFENVAYYHSIFYDNLKSYCYLLSIWKDDGFCLSYDEQKEWAELLDLAQPTEFYRGKYDEEKIIEITKNLDLKKVEGYVLRNTQSFHRDEYRKNTAKYVRPNHIQPNAAGDVTHWLKNTYKNQLNTDLKVKPFYMDVKKELKI